MATAGRTRSRIRYRRPRPTLRWLLVAGAVLVLLLYYRPLKSYFETSGEVSRQTSEVRSLQEEHRELEQRLAASRTTAAVVREARKLGLVRPGEQLFIVKGIEGWRARPRHR